MRRPPSGTAVNRIPQRASLATAYRSSGISEGRRNHQKTFGMTTTMPLAQSVPVPTHVAPQLVYDFDYFHVAGIEQDVQLAWHALHSLAPDIFWTPRNGGHWVATRFADIKLIQQDFARFSSSEIVIPAPPRQRPYKVLPISADPPAHAPYRRLIAPAFLPRALDAFETEARALTVCLIEGLLSRGECEFMSEFARIMPMNVFLRMVDLPAADRPYLISLAEANVRSCDMELKILAHEKLAAYLQGWIARRTAEPGEDLISRITHAQIDGKRLGREEVFGLLINLMLGGLDTVANMLGYVARFLALSAAHRRRLIEDPGIVARAIEEMIRRFGLSNTGRRILKDCDYRGIPFRQDELILVPSPMGGMDERVVRAPETVDFDREPPIAHTAFGHGPHACPGAALARREIRVFIEEWLKRIPEFRIKPGTLPRLATGTVNAVTELQLSWP